MKGKDLSAFTRQRAFKQVSTPRHTRHMPYHDKAILGLRKNAGLGECSACMAPSSLPLLGNYGGLLENVPWKWMLGTAVVTAGAVGFLTWKVAEMMITKQVALKVSGLGESKRKRSRRKNRRKR